MNILSKCCMHNDFQAVPVPTDCMQEIKETFIECAEAESFELHEIPKHSDLKQVLVEMYTFINCKTLACIFFVKFAVRNVPGTIVIPPTV